MVKLIVPQRVTLPNGRTFVAHYKWISRDLFPPNIVMRRTYTQSAASTGLRIWVRAAQQGQGIFDFVKKVARNTLVKSIARQDLTYAPGAYGNWTKRAKNRTLKRILNSDMAHSTLINFMDINPKNNSFLFDSFGIEGFKLFIVNNDQDIVNKLLYNFEKCESKSNQKLELCTMKFCVETWQKISHKKKKKVNRHSSKLFLFVRTIYKIKKDSLHEHLNIRKSNSRFN